MCRLQHILLCKVLCGRQETLKDGGAKGSSQFEPSSADFDSGIDDPDCPHRILLWSSTLGWDMLPQYVVSVRKLKEGGRNLEMATDGMDASLEVGRGLEEAGGDAGPAAAAAPAPVAYARATPQNMRRRK